MTIRHKSILKTVMIAMVFFALIVSACHGAASTKQPGVSTTPSAALETPAEPTPLPSPTTAPGKVWLVAPPGSDASLVEGIHGKLGELADKEGYSLDQTDNLTTSQLDQNTKIVVWLGENADIANLAGTAPQTHFIMIGPGQGEPTANLSLINTSNTRVSFIAGLIATLVAPDRRSGGLFSADDPLDAQLQDSFANGGRYLCGRCTPIYAPVVFFPVTTSVSPSLRLDGWKAGFDSLNQNRIEVLYIPPLAATPDFLTYLNGQGVAVVGSAAPPDGFSNQWVATVSQDVISPLVQLWPELMQTEGTGKAINAPIVMTDINDQRLTPGKLELAKEVAADLAAGYISPLSVP